MNLLKPFLSTDLSALSYMPYLLELDASHNLLTHLLDFAPPKNLKSADFSFNEIEEMGDLSDHHYLTKLVLDNNQITEVRHRFVIAVCIYRYVITFGLRSKYDVFGHYFRFMIVLPSINKFNMT